MRGYYRAGRAEYWPSVVGLVGHLVGTALIFCVFLGLVWLLSVFLHWLNGMHPFPPEIYAIVTKIEVWLIYVDAILCTVVLIAGAWRFCRELLGRY